MTNKSPKFVLIHRVFSLARTLNKKVYMSEKDFKAFYKAAQGEGYNGAEYAKELVIFDYREALKVKAIYLDHNSVYGGYRIDRFDNMSGGTSFVFSAERHNANTLTTILSYAMIHQNNVEKGF